MAACSRPVITTIVLRDGRKVDRCETCLRPGPPDDDGAWAASHRGDAVAANVEIGDRAVAG